MRDLTSTLQRLDPAGARAVRHALHIAGGFHCLRMAHLMAGLLMTDGGLVLRKLRGTRIDRAAVVRQVYLSAGAPNNADPAGTVRILLLAGTLARPGVRINTQHLLAAILLADGNPVAACLTTAGIDRHLFVRQRFAHLFAVDDALRDLAPDADAGAAGEALGHSAVALHTWAVAARPRLPEPAVPPPRPPVSAVRPPRPPVPPMPPAARADPDPRLPERTATQWLRKLIPHQADRYAEHGFVEIDSTLTPDRRYRVHRDRQTQIYEQGAPRARTCLRLSDAALPPTDRVIAEYFLIQGDERSYLKKANIFPG